MQIDPAHLQTGSCTLAGEFAHTPLLIPLPHSAVHQLLYPRPPRSQVNKIDANDATA